MFLTFCVWLKAHQSAILFFEIAPDRVSMWDSEESLVDLKSDNHVVQVNYL